MKITFLGTSCVTPTKERNHTAIHLQYENETILIDCGEGTQRQFRIANLNPCKITRILLTHWHGDHTLGLPGLLQTLALNNYNKTLQIYGPKGTKQFISQILKTFKFIEKIKLQVNEVTKKTVLKTEKFEIQAAKLKHPSLGYLFKETDKRKILKNKLHTLKIPQGPHLKKLQQGKTIKHKGKTISPNTLTKVKKGKSITFILDTAYTKAAEQLAKNTSLLISESTYLSNLEKKAKQNLHMTAKQAATLAKKAKAKSLILTHFSQRHKNPKDFLKEAKKVFPNTQLAKDFMQVTI